MDSNVGSSMIPPVPEYSPETESFADFSNSNLVTPQSINSQAGLDATVSDDLGFTSWQARNDQHMQRIRGTRPGATRVARAAI